MAILDVDHLKNCMKAQAVTQSEVARISGVSRATVSRLLGQRQSRVHQATLERLAQTLRVAPVQLTVGGELERFKRLVAEEQGELDFRGMGMPRLQRQPIEDVFVDVAVREEADGAGDQCSQTLSRAGRRDPSEPILATECIRTNDRVVLLGDPGSGKTTVLRYLAHWCATGEGEDRGTPIYVRLPDLCRVEELLDEPVDIVELVAARATDRCPEIESTLRAELKSDKSCLVLLDGLDEVGSQKGRERVIECVHEFIDKYPCNQFAVTSRVVGFGSAPWRQQGFAIYGMSTYDRKQLETFAEKWAKILSRQENKPYEETLKTLNAAIFSNPRVRALASNPLILTILVLLNETRGGSLSRRRVDLYEKVVDVFLDTWESNKQSVDKFNDTFSIDLDAREFRWLLSDLALAMQKAERTVAARWWLAERMQEYLLQRLGFDPQEAKGTCDRIIRYLIERTGLVEERGPDLFAFSHRTLQEYFASLGVIDEADASASRDATSCLRSYYFHPQWAEVVRLVAAQLTPPLAESLLSSILDDPDPIGRFMRRGQFLALRCLSDGTTIANRRLLTGIFDSLESLGQSRWLGITLEAMDILGSLRGTRLQKDAERTITAILKTAEKELDEDEFACLHEGAHVREILKAAQRALPNGPEDDAAREVTVAVGGRKCHVVCLNVPLFLDDADSWYASVCSLLKDPQQSTRLKEALVCELGRRATTDPRSQIRLRRILRQEQDATVRAASALALAGVTKLQNRTSQRLVRVLNHDADEEVRMACAIALRDVAGRDAAIRRRLMDILDSEQPACVRAGAAAGLAEAVDSHADVLELLQRCASIEEEPDNVRASCARALQRQIGKAPAISETFKSWLDATDPPRLQLVAAESLANAMADERMEWDHAILETIGSVLMGMKHPVPDALQALRELAAARETRHGLRLESVLRDSLLPLADQIDMAFVFGSTARNRQNEDSDIDLLVMGSVNLKDMSGPLREAERILGRRINPVIYTRDSFRQKFQAGDPFLLDVYRREKIPVIEPERDSSRKDLDDELRAMVAERVATKT